MTALSGTGAPPMREFTVPPGARTMQPRGASTTFYAGGLLMHRAGSDLVEHPSASAPRTDLIAVGTFVSTTVTYVTGTATDSSGGATLPNGIGDSLTIETGHVGWFDSATGGDLITNNNVDQVCYAVDNNTLALTDGNGTRSAAGYVAQVRADGKVKLRIDASVYLTNRDPLPSATQDDLARAVATSLPAGTFASGVLTLTATGAFSTAQDGVTLAVGDKFIIPAGTITTLVVSAANSGVYEVTSLGATGASAVFTRTAKFAQGATITPQTKIRVGPEGTVFANTIWTAKPATFTKVVGTDDPQLAPDSVTQKVQLASSTVTISNVPIRNADATQVVARLNTANGTLTSTVGYGTPTAGVTVGGVGTGSVVVDALASGMGKNGTADTSFLTVTISQ